MKKLLSIILTISMLFTASAVGVSAILEPTGEYTPGEGVETNRYYFYMPQEWYNEYTNTAGVYWWDGTDACGVTDYSLSWPGYKARESFEKGIFYVDCPKDVPTIVWNNYVNGGDDPKYPIYLKAVQSRDNPVEYYSDGDRSIYSTEFFEYVEESYKGDKSALGEYADNFFMEEELGFGLSFTMDNMIYVIDPTLTVVNSSGKSTYWGEWYFYYGNGEYGTYPVKTDAEIYGEVNLLDGFQQAIPPVTPPVTIPEGESFIYFDVNASGWQNVRSVFCHMWRFDGTGKSHAWQSKKEKCVYDESTGIAYYDLSKLNFPVTPEDGNEYCVIFSANTGMQTYHTVMSGSCIGDTMYCNGEQIENPEDSEKLCNVAVWKNNPDCGPEKKITTTGNIVGTAYPEGETDEGLLADYLIKYYNDWGKVIYTEKLVNELCVSPTVVMDVVMEKVGEEDSYNKILIIEKILNEIPDPTKTIECDLNDDGYTNIIDATLIQKYAAELIAFTSSQCKVADINSDGVVNVVDTTLVQKRLAGI